MCVSGLREVSQSVRINGELVWGSRTSGQKNDDNDDNEEKSVLMKVK